MVKEQQKTPQGELAIRIVAMPANTNPNGDIFGGWVVSQMDLAGVTLAKQHTKNRVATVAIDSMTFLAPVRVGELVCCYGELVKKGTTSITIKIEAWVLAPDKNKFRQVTQGIFTFVSINDQGRPISL